MRATSISSSPTRIEMIFPFCEKDVPGANHAAICAGSVTACQTRSRGAAIQILRSIAILPILFPLLILEIYVLFTNRRRVFAQETLHLHLAHLHDLYEIPASIIKDSNGDRTRLGWLHAKLHAELCQPLIFVLDILNRKRFQGYPLLKNGFL